MGQRERNDEERYIQGNIGKGKRREIGDEIWRD